MPKRKIANFFKYTAKFVLAGIVAVLILSILMYGVKIKPVHISNPNANTDYVWDANSMWLDTTEGVSYGKFDANGYNNASVIENPDILLIGSSHMEATNVMQNENAGYLLNEMFKGEHSVYNLSISGHRFMKVCHYLPKNIELYKNSVKYVVIEMSDLLVTNEDVDSVVNHDFQIVESRTDGILGFLQRIPFFKAAYQNIYPAYVEARDRAIAEEAAATAENAQAGEESQKTEIDELPYERLFDYLGKIEEDSGVQIVVAYHPFEIIDAEGDMYFLDEDIKKVFVKKAKEHGVDIVDLSDSFIDMYNKYHILPHGFITGKLGVGHINKYGHKAFAEAVYAKIKEMDGEY